MDRKRVALVTGAAQGIGLAIAEKLVSRNISVALIDINEEKVKNAADQLASINLDVAGFCCDVSSLESIRIMIGDVLARFGQIDIVVNNAGILNSAKLPDITEEEWNKVMRVNVNSVAFVTQQAAPYLKLSCHPRIINISSIAGRMGGFEAGLAYAASKGAVITLTYGLARDLAPSGITVNCVCPGTIATDMIASWSDAQIKGLENRIPLRRLGKPEDIASAVAFLASEEAGFITGLLMDVNGGMYFG